MTIVREKHHLILRLSHWINVPLLSLMIWSGLLIYWAHQPYITIPDDLGPFELHHRLAEGMAWHFTLMWLLVINGCIYFSFLCFSGEWRELAPYRRIFLDAFHYTLFDLKISRNCPEWNGKFNPAQRLAYFSAIILSLGAVITGLAIYKPVTLNFLLALLGGYEVARFLHFFCMISLVAFIFLHLLQVARAGWNNFRAMVAGYEMEK